MLTSNETAKLIIDAQKGDNLAKEKLITLNSPLIKSVVKRYLNKGVDYDDLYQLGALGFVKAINNFDPKFNVKFTTYAVPMIAGEIKRFLRDDGSVKVSRSIKHLSIEINNYVTEYVRLHGENPSYEHLSQHFNMEKAEIVFAMEAVNRPLSIDEKYNDDEDSVSLKDKLPDSFSYENYVDKLALREMISGLEQREKQVIIMRYYLDKTQSEIAAELNISQVQVSRIENKVLKQLKNALFSDKQC